MSELYSPLQEFYVWTPIGKLRIWCPEAETRYNVPQICIDYLHRDGDIPLVRTEFSYIDREVHTQVYGDMYCESPTSKTTHMGLSGLNIERKW